MAVTGTSYAQFLRENPDLVEQVLSRAESNKAPATSPAPVTQQAQPVVAEPVTPPPSPIPTVAPVERPNMRNPQRALQGIQDDRIEGQNDIAQSYLREGQAKAEGAQKSADELGSYKDRISVYANDAEANHKANRAQADKYKKYMDEDMAKLREPLLKENGFQRATAIISGIVGAMGAQQGGTGGAGLAAGMAMLNDHVHRNLRDQLAEKDQAGRNLEHTEKAIASLAKDSSDELDVANKLMANQWLMSEAELKKLAEETKGTQYSEDAFRLAEGARDKANEYLEKIARERIAKEEAQRRAGASKRLDAALSQLRDQELMALGTKEALAKLKERQGIRKGEADIDNTLADTSKKRGEGAGSPAPVGRTVEDPALWNSINDTEKAKYRKAEAAMLSFERDAKKLDDLLAKHGNESFGKHSKDMAALQAGLLGSYKEIKDLGALDNGVIELVDRAIGDPTALFSSGENTRERLNTTRQSLRAGMEATAKGLGLGSNAPEDRMAKDVQRGGKAAPAASTPDPNAPVPMRTQDGRQVMIPPHLTSTAVQRGLVPESEWSAQQDDAKKEADYQAMLAENEADYERQQMGPRR